MRRIVSRIRVLALTLGAPGLFLVAFLDSSFLPLPGITDVLLVVMVTRHPAGMLLYVAATVAGSIAGCLVLHYLGRKGGEALVRKRFTGDKTERAIATLRRHGIIAVLVPCLLPPPAPFKIFVLLAGVIGISASRLAMAIAIGRGMRYLALGLLAVQYGERAMTYLRDNGTVVSLIALGTLAAGFGAYLLWTRRRAGKGR
jgi:membrane protein YqaA with SNARE-associated domain